MDVLSVIKEYSPVFLAISKYAVVVIFALNFNSFPLVWHFRTFGRVYWHSFFEDHNKSIGINPFKTVSTTKFRATMDDCDAFGFHLSNSSYAKNLDTARLDAWTTLNFRLFKEAKIWTPLGASIYYFIKEIPFGKKYEIKTSIGAYENDKWYYFLSKFVSKKSKKAAQKSPNGNPTHLATAGSHALSPEAASGTSTPLSTSKDAAQNNLIAQAYNELGPDEELNCVAITQYCYKCGRVTIPPPIALGLAGLGEHGKKNHATFEKLVKERKLKDYAKGGFKDSAFGDVELNINDLEVVNAQRIAPYKVFNESLSAFKSH
ncbi:hypothetical protein E3P77_03819 [Wallemia ichthyophaga]|nr:hypothetical protein E3P77_03819 [Wallemia ichthyophaga]